MRIKFNCGVATFLFHIPGGGMDVADLGIAIPDQEVQYRYTRAFGDGPRNLNHGQVPWTTPELTPPLLTTTPHQREDVLALDRFSVHRCPTRRVFSGTGLELVTMPAMFRYL
ncbi:uncharacterized protein TNCV_924831 [Trichonephila clavipes]|nr:uncharacterized protein TNCV_924831 [Trichonephila clavipes]